MNAYGGDVFCFPLISLNRNNLRQSKSKKRFLHWYCYSSLGAHFIFWQSWPKIGKFRPFHSSSGLFWPSPRKKVLSDRGLVLDYTQLEEDGDSDKAPLFILLTLCGLAVLSQAVLVLISKGLQGNYSAPTFLMAQSTSQIFQQLSVMRLALCGIFGKFVVKAKPFLEN